MSGRALPRAIGRYEILEEIERGATALAYRGRDAERDRPVVVRVLVPPPEAPGEGGQGFEGHFLGEGRRVSLLSHPCLVAIHDCGKDEATAALFVVEEDVAGTPLSHALVAGEALPWPQALRLVAGLGRALETLHAAGLVHGAVGPDNIVLGPGMPKLADRGLARFTPARGERAIAAPLYLSPERAVGECVGVTADLFALGAVAYRLLTGRDAFEADTPEKILARVIHDRPQRASAIVPGLPPGVDEVLWKALAKPRKERYATAGCFCEDVEDLLAGRSPRLAAVPGDKVDTSRFLAAAGAGGEPGDATGAGSNRWERRRPVVRALVGLLALSLVGGLEILRRELEEPGGPAAGLPGAEPLPRSGDAPRGDVVPDLPSIEDPAPLARLSLDFRHTLEKGTLVLLLDGETILDSRVTGAVTRKLLGIKLREGRLRQVIEVPPGRHQIRLRVRWNGDQRSETITGDFAAGATRRLSARLGRIGRPLSVEWE